MDTKFTPQELYAMREMGYTVKDIERLKKERNNWDKVKVESYDERIVKEKEDLESELDFNKGE